MKEIRTGVIGVGSMGKNHVRVYNEISNLVGISDLDEKNGRSIAEKYKIKYFKKYEDLLLEVDAVTIAVPTENHFEIASRVISSNVNLLIEKPLAMDYGECIKIINLANKAGVCLAVGHIERYNPIIKEVRKRITNKEWGEIITISSRRFSSFPGRVIDVGVVFDLAIHDIDILCYLSGSKVKSVYSIGGKHKHEQCEDFIMILIDFENGLKGLCEANWLTPTKVRQLSITTDNAHIVADYIDQTIEISKASLVDGTLFHGFQPNIKFNKEMVNIIRKEPLKNELIDFLNSIEEKRETLVTGFDGATAVAIANAATESLRTGKIEFL